MHHSIKGLKYILVPFSESYLTGTPTKYFAINGGAAV